MARRMVMGWMVLGLLAAPSWATDDQPNELQQIVVKLIGDQDKLFRAAGLDQVRSGAKGEEATKLFAAQLPRLDAAGQVALLSALADRGDAAARPAVLELLTSSQDESVRAAAIAALGALGKPADLPLLI
ncbi:MAG TPA: HEAT repeat domain-containing protein, partial [Pirellulales bacterium]|nr:HEAT repeat domain-containing protein [Pirellulales bacterium]